MTAYDALLMRFFTGELSLEQWAAEADRRFLVPATPAKTVLKPLTETCPTWYALLAAEQTKISYQEAA